MVHAAEGLVAMESESYEGFKARLLRCRDCMALGIEPNPIVWGDVGARIVQISQAPSQNAGRSGRPFSKSLREPDESGKKLIEWYAIPREAFYDPGAFYITSMAHCYPGKGKSGDAKPPLVCARKWLRRELSHLDPRLHIIVGRHSASFFFPDRDFTGLVFQDLEINRKAAFVLPHPSPANKKWFKDNPRFGAERLQELRKAVHEALQ